MKIAARHIPKVGLVSLGCPKALVDSERILTQLRAEGYVISPGYDSADVVIVNTCGFLDSAKAESLAAIGEAVNENGRVIVTGCMGVEADTIRAAHPSVLAVTGPHQYEAVVSAVHDAVPPVHDAKFDLIPPQGLRLTPTSLRLSEDLGGLQQPLLFLHHPITARRPRQPACGIGPLRSRATGQSRRQGTAGHISRHERLWHRSQIRGEQISQP